MTSSPARLPLFARLLLRLIGRPGRDRAEADLADVYARVARTRGASSARRACVREAASIVVWTGIEAVRRMTDRRAGAAEGGIMRSGIGQDIGFAFRALSRRPGFTAIAAGVLALGIGANVAIFTLADRLFLEDPPLVEAPDELIRVFRSWAPGQGGSLSYPDYEDYRDGSTTLAGLMASGGPYVASARSIGSPVPADVLTVTANYFDVLGIEPATGRFFLSEENETPDAHPVAIVSHDWWRSRMGASPDAVGSVVALNGTSFTVVGVAPRGFRGLTPGSQAPDFWIPILMRNAILPRTLTAWRERVPNQRERWLSVVGRLAAGQTVAATQTEMSVIAERIKLLEGEDAALNETVLVTADYRWHPSSHTSLLALTRVLLVTVALLLAVAIANVTILLLARASSRNREIGIRSALGAGRVRVARQMLVESALIGIGGCVAGVILSIGAARVAGAMLPVDVAAGTLPDAGILAFALLLSLSTALLAGVFPALRATRTDVAGMIHGRDRHGGGGRVRDVLVVLQVALSLVLVAGAALFARSLQSARSVDVGFDDRGVLFVGINLRNHGYDDARGRMFVDEALERIQRLPGVSIATVSRQVPFRGDWSGDLRPWDGDAFADGRDILTTGYNVVGPRYFEAMNIPVVRGRAFDETDREGSQFVIVVNETFARLAFPEGDAIGRMIPLRSEVPDALIVGVARDATYYQLAEDAWAQVYAAFGQMYMPDIRLMVKTPGDPAALAPSVQQAVLAIDGDVAITSTETLEAVHAEQTARYRASASVVGLSGIIALLLACAGLYGVMAFRVSRRTREIGVRMALGATRGAVAVNVLRHSLTLVVAGSAIGLAGAIMLGRFVAGMVFGVPARDPVSLVAAPVVLLVVAAIAALVPARRAAGIDPARAIRVE
jgi:predicted permease